MKKFKSVFLIVILLFSLTGCDFREENKKVNESYDEKRDEDVSDKSLVLYFSATNNTKKVAKFIAEINNGDIIEILPEVPYTAQDLDYNKDCRANREQNDDKSRPSISNTNIKLDQYDTVYLGYPIW